MCANRRTLSRSPRSPPGRKYYCNKGAKFGQQNLHGEPPRLIPERAVDLRHLPECRCAGVRHHRPLSRCKIAHFFPPTPEKMVDPRPNRPRVIQSNDVYVAPDGLMYVTDVNDGLTIVQYKG